MSERILAKRLFWSTPVSGTAVSGPQSSAIDVRMGVIRLESLTYVLSSVVSTPDIGIFYAVSPDGTMWGSYADNTALLTSTISGGNAQGYHTMALPNALAPFIRFAVSGTGSNPQDTLCTLDLVLRLSS